MAIKIIKGTIKVGDEYIGACTVVMGLDEADEQRLISEGMAAYVPDSEAEEQCEGGFDIGSMTVPKLKEFAKTNGIDIGKAKTKVEILAAIAEAADGGGDIDEEDDDPDA